MREGGGAKLGTTLTRTPCDALANNLEDSWDALIANKTSTGLQQTSRKVESDKGQEKEEQ